MAACGGSAPGGDGEVLQPRVGVQNVVVMRHGDRIDSFEPLWTVNAERPWDPPLTGDGRTRAWNSRKRLRASHLGFPIHRVVVSPFLRCLQTASEVISALCAATDDDDDALLAAETSRSNIPTDPSRLKIPGGTREIESGFAAGMPPEKVVMGLPMWSLEPEAPKMCSHRW